MPERRTKANCRATATDALDLRVVARRGRGAIPSAPPEHEKARVPLTQLRYCVARPGHWSTDKRPIDVIRHHALRLCVVRTS